MVILLWPDDGPTRLHSIDGLPGEEWYTGLVERSFSLDHVLDRTQFFWSSEKAHTNIGVTLYDVDGWKYAQHRKEMYEGYFPDAKFFIFDARDEELLPVTLDWHQWLLDSVPKNAFSVKDKYGSRNIKFTIDPSKPMII